MYRGCSDAGDYIKVDSRTRYDSCAVFVSLISCHSGRTRFAQTLPSVTAADSDLTTESHLPSGNHFYESSADITYILYVLDTFQLSVGTYSAIGDIFTSHPNSLNSGKATATVPCIDRVGLPVPIPATLTQILISKVCDREGAAIGNIQPDKLSD